MEKNRIHFGALPLNVCMRLVEDEIANRLENTDIIVESVGVEDDIYFRDDDEYELINARIKQEPSDWVLFWDPDRALIQESMTMEEYAEEQEALLQEMQDESEE